MLLNKRQIHTAGPLSLLLLCFSLTLILAAVIGLAIGVGSVAIDQSTVWGVIAYKLQLNWFEPFWSLGRENIIWSVRLPRTLLAAIVGAALAIVGAALQSVTRNPLADPHLMGVSSGAALGAIVALLHTGLIVGSLTVPLFAFIGALLATLIVLLVANFSGAHQSGRIVLSGVAVSFVLSACGSMLIFMGDHRAAHTLSFGCKAA